MKTDDILDLAKRLDATPLHEGSGEQSDLPERAAEALRYCAFALSGDDTLKRLRGLLAIERYDRAIEVIDAALAKDEGGATLSRETEPYTREQVEGLLADAKRWRKLRDTPATRLPEPLRRWLWERPGGAETLDGLVDRMVDGGNVIEGDAA